MMEEFKEVIEYIEKGAYTIGDISSRFPNFDKNELEETLEGFVGFKKISKTRTYFHGNDITPPEKRSRNQFTGNALDCTEIEYPDWVVTDRDKIKFLTSPESPKIAKSMNFFVDDIDTKNTGRILFDSLNSNHIMTSIYLSPNTNGDGNKIDYKKDVTQARGFHVLVRDGKFTIDVSLLKTLQPKYANHKTESVSDRFRTSFDSYEEFVTWLKNNL